MPGSAASLPPDGLHDLVVVEHATGIAGEDDLPAIDRVEPVGRRQAFEGLVEEADGRGQRAASRFGAYDRRGTMASSGRASVRRAVGGVSSAIGERPAIFTGTAAAALVVVGLGGGVAFLGWRTGGAEGLTASRTNPSARPAGR